MGRAAQCVITSYSIHYTKLYDDADEEAGEELPPQGAKAAGLGQGQSGADDAFHVSGETSCDEFHRLLEERFPSSYNFV